ncbi:MAG: hypothetical protein MUO64_08970 [Anaerolineales bacterium]|nr:hypothetical protein [Anaerolineales bacterium]
MLEAEGFPYIGSDETALELVLSKAALKGVWRATGIQTPGYFVGSGSSAGMIDGFDQLEVKQEFPYIVKPSKGGNSRGILEDPIVFNTSSRKKLVQDLLVTYD